MSADDALRTIRVGVDVLERHELDRLLRRPWFLSFGYAPEEREEAEGMGPERRTEFLAGRFAAKEAVLKSLGRGMLQGIALRDICVARDEDGAARVDFLRGAGRMGLPPVSLSISHKDNVVVAVALCADRAPDGGAAHRREEAAEGRCAGPRRTTDQHRSAPTEGSRDT